MTNKIVIESKNESEILGFKVSRCNEDFLDVQQFKDEIFQGKYDLCRLKLPCEDEYISMKLHEIKLPFFFSGSIRRYKTPIHTKPEGEFIYPDMTYEQYDGTQDELLYKMLKGTWGDYPLGYYRTPYLNSLVDKEIELKSVFNFYKYNNLNIINPNNSILFMNHNGNYVGFFALNKIGGGVESHIGGILEPYRKGGYFLDMLRYIKNFCVNNHLSHFAFGARNENAYVQKIFQDVGFKPIGTENVFHIVPMLSLSQSEVRMIELDNVDLDIILNSLKSYLKSIGRDYTINSIMQTSKTSLTNLKHIRILFTLPINTDEIFLIVAKIVDEQMDISECVFVEGQWI